MNSDTELENLEPVRQLLEGFSISGWRLTATLSIHGWLRKYSGISFRNIVAELQATQKILAWLDSVLMTAVEIDPAMSQALSLEQVVKRLEAAMTVTIGVLDRWHIVLVATKLREPDQYLRQEFSVGVNPAATDNPSFTTSVSCNVVQLLKSVVDNAKPPPNP